MMYSSKKYCCFFLFYSSPDPAIVKTFSRIFGNFNTENLSWIYIIFHILNQPKNPRKKKFQRHSLLTALHSKNLRMRTAYSMVLVLVHRWSARLIKSKIVIITPLHPYHLPAITEFSIFRGHPIIHSTYQQGKKHPLIHLALVIVSRTLLCN